MSRRLVTIIFLLMWTSMTAHATDDAPPSWSFDIKGGRFTPELKDWKTYYGDDDMPQFSAALAWKPLRMLDVGVELAYLHDSGEGDFPLQGGQGGDVDYTLYPLSAYAVLRGVFHESQWLVPYIGAGMTRFYYEQKIKYQDKVQGKANGIYYKGGLQFLLDNLDRGASNMLAAKHGVNNTYLILEAQRTNVEIDNVKLGGTSYQVGLLFEF